MSKIDKRSLKTIDLTGNRYGKLTVVEKSETKIYGNKIAWLCKCDCGNMSIVSGASLKRGDSTSCKCMQGVKKDKDLKPLWIRRTHRNKLYNRWADMNFRCYHSTAPHYEYYGGRGIKVCDEWKTDFEEFARWSMLNGYTSRMEIDRIDSDGMYCPDNCRWITHKQNSRNRGTRKSSNSGRAGVSWRPNRNGIGGKWRVAIGVDAKNVNIGHFDNLQEAIQARREAELKYWGFIAGERG